MSKSLLVYVLFVRGNAIAVDSVVECNQNQPFHLSHPEMMKITSYLRSIRTDTVKFINVQPKLCDYVATQCLDVSKLFSYGVETTYDYPEAPDLEDDHWKTKAHLERASENNRKKIIQIQFKKSFTVYCGNIVHYHSEVPQSEGLFCDNAR